MGFGSPGAKVSRFKGQPEAPSTAHVKDTLCTTITFARFASSLPRWILRSRTGFGAYLASVFASPSDRSGSAPPTATFPLPLPYLGLFKSSGPRLSRANWRHLYQRRLLCVVVLALNFIHDGFRRPPLHLLWRLPNAHQRQAYQRMLKLIQACDRQEDFPLPPGRSGCEFIARLLELESFATRANLGPGSAYCAEAPFASPVPPIPTSASLPQLQPYRSLDTSRLKLFGEGRWDMESWLEGPLWLPFVEPAILLHGGSTDPTAAPTFSGEDRAENLKLAALWSAKGLLRLERGTPPPGSRARVFNAFKDEARDRQIGDRRLQNGREMHLSGPSALLPAGTSLLCIELRRHTERAVAFISDRKDYYHQANVSRARAASNCLPFAYTGRELASVGIGATSMWEPRSLLVASECYTPTFASLFQGDHHGVEFALESHFQMLRFYSAIRPELCLFNREPPPLGPDYQALVIDDFVCVSTVPCHAPAGACTAARLHARAQHAYQHEGVEGSPQKDVLGADLFTAIGAEIDTGPWNLSSGIATCGAPLPRRIALASLSLRAAALPLTSATLCARLSGSWVSAALYRRCLMVIFSEVFSVAQGSTLASPAQTAVPQSRRLAQELVLASTLAPFFVSDLTAETLGKVYATDASLGIGAYCSAEVPQTVARSVWLNADRRGGYSRLDTGPRELLRAAGVPSSFEDLDAEPPPAGRQVPFDIDVLPLGRPSAVFGESARACGLRLGPCIHTGASEHFDVTAPSFQVWLHSAMKEGCIRSLLILPPTSGQYLAGGSFRSAGSRTLAQAYLVCFRLAASLSVPCLLLAPRGLPLCSTPAWSQLAARPDVSSGTCDSCMYGEPRRRCFAFLAFAVPSGTLHRSCNRGHPQDEGRGLPWSDPLPAGFAAEVAASFARVLPRANRASEPLGIESIINNDLLSACCWQVDRVVPWRGKSHINTLELGTIGILERDLAISHPRSRFTVLVDSSVAKASSAKGRSTSFALQPGLRRATAHQIGFDLCPAFGFAPTRLNVADDPTRRTPLRPPAAVALHARLPLPVVHYLGRLRLRRPLASWARLFLVLLSVRVGFSDSFLSSLAGRFAPLLVADPLCPFEFDSTLGYPGEGPWCCLGFGPHSCVVPSCPSPLLLGPGSCFDPPRHSCRCPSFRCGLLFLFFFAVRGSLRVEPSFRLPPTCLARSAWILLDFDSSLGFPGEGWWLLFRVFGVLVVLAVAMAAPAPMTPADTERATRRAGLLLQADRVIRPVTRSNRAKLAEAFSSWLFDTQGRSLETLIAVPFDQVEQISEALVAFGQHLFRSGQAYYKFSETINAVASLRPSIRRSLTRPWDLAFAWLTEEPSIHHRAMPKSILLAIMSVALLWGWPVEAAIFGMSWAGLLRIGETLNAVRADLILPDDAAPGFGHALLQIRSPKTRGRAARHQAARIDPADIICLLCAVLGPLPPSAKLWPFSDGVLRRRFRAIQTRLGLQDRNGPLFDLASLRPGGATWMLERTENAELVRRRGRWLSGRVMEIYLQEVTAATFVARLPKDVRNSVEQLEQSFAAILQKAVFLESSYIPRKAWYHMFLGRSTARAGD